MAATEALPSFDPMPGVWPRYHGKSFFFMWDSACLPRRRDIGGLSGDVHGGSNNLP